MNTIPRVRNGYKIDIVYSITLPKGVKKIGVSTDAAPNDYVIISVTPEKPYRFILRYVHIDPTDENPDTEFDEYAITELNYNISHGATFDKCHGTYYITYSEEINNAESYNSW